MFQQNKIIKNSIFIIIWLLCLLGTYGLIKHKDSGNNVNIKEKEFKKNVDGMDFYDLYYENPIEIMGDIQDDGTYKSTIQIQGLLVQNIEDNINNMLKEKYNTLNENVYTTIQANFSNILSLTIKEDNTIIQSINIDLTTGKNLTIEDIFTNNANINSIISKCFYNSLSLKYINNDIEGKLIEIMRDIKKNNYTFYLKNNGVYLIYSEIVGYVSTYDYGSSLAYFKRFLSKDSIYVNELTNTIAPINEVTNSNLNIFSNISDYGYFYILSNENVKIDDNISKDIKNNILSLKSNMDTSKFNIILGNIDYQSISDDIYYINIKTNICKVDKKLKYDDTTKQYLLDNDCPTLKDNNFYIKDNKLYSIDNIKQLFSNNFDYKEYFKNIIEEYGIYDEAEYTINGKSIDIHIDNHDISILLEDIGLENLSF